MPAISANPTEYAISKLRTVWTRAGLDPMTVQGSQGHPALRAIVTPGPGQQLDALWAQLLYTLLPLVADLHPPPEIIRITESLLQAGIFRALLSILTRYSAITYGCDPRVADPPIVSTLALWRCAF